MTDLTPPDALEWADIEKELCSTAREACAFGANWLDVPHLVAPGSDLENLARATPGAPAHDRHLG